MSNRRYNVMRNILLVLMVSIIISTFSACENPTDDTTQSDASPKTQIEFKNFEQHPVIIYSDPAQQVIFAEVAANGTTKVAATPAPAGIAFYPTFRINLPGIEGMSTPYDGPPIITLIEENKTTLVPIPKLESISINKTFLSLTNNSNFSLSLREGSLEKAPLGGKPGIVISGQSAAYEINQGPSSVYTAMRNTTTPIAFPASLAEFEQGKVYIFTYNGTDLVLTATWPIPSPLWPSAPENFQAELISTSSVRFSWNTVYDAESYQVYRAVGSATASYSRIATTNTPSYTNTGLSNNLYHYKVSAIKGSKEGEQSKAVPVRIAYPGGTGMFSGGDSFVLFYWSNISGASSYNIYRSETVDGNYLKVDTVTPASGTYSFSWGGTGLEPRTTYYFRLSAVFDGTESLPIPAIRANTVPPLDFRVTETTATSISLAWNTTNVDWKSFSIYRSTSENGTFTRIINNLSADSYTNTGISPNSTYYYYIGITFNTGSSGTFTKLLTDRKVSATTEEE